LIKRHLVGVNRGFLTGEGVNGSEGEFEADSAAEAEAEDGGRREMDTKEGHSEWA
jgi:hypothetical protein